MHPLCVASQPLRKILQNVQGSADRAGLRFARPLQPANSNRQRDKQVTKTRSDAGKQPQDKARGSVSQAEDRVGTQSRPESVRRERIAVAAYYNAERRGFSGNAELDDWLDAEKAIDGATPDDAAAQLDPGADSSDLIYPEDIDEWAERLDVTREQLRVAIRQVGSRFDDVARFLGNPDVR